MHRPLIFLRKLLLTACLAAICLVSVPTQAQEPQEDSLASLRRATVFLLQTYDTGATQALSCVGSGTLISADGLILTNAHLSAARGPCRGERLLVALPVRLEDPPVPTYIAELVQSDERFDVALLRIVSSLDGSPIEPQTLNLPFVPLGDSFGLLPGNQLTYVGYPDIGGQPVQASQAVISGITSDEDGGSFAWMRTEAALPGTLSGGGAFNPQGQLVGIMTSAPVDNSTTPGPTCLSIQDTTQDNLITPQDACVPIGAPINALRPVNLALPLIESARTGIQADRQPGIFASAPVGPPAASRLFFATEVSAQGVPNSVFFSAPSGTTNVYLFFDYTNFTNGTPFAIQVRRDGIDLPEFSLGPVPWGGGPSGKWYYGTENTTWPDGTYEFTLLWANEPLASAQLTIGQDASAPRFANLVFGTPDANNALTFISNLLPAEIPQITAQFDYVNMQPEQAWTEVWYLDGTEISRNERVWDGGTNGSTTVTATNLEGLPLGTYRLELYLGQELALTGDVILAGTRGSEGQPVIFAGPAVASDITRDGEPAGELGKVLPIGVSSIYMFVDYNLMPSGTIWTYRWFLDGRLVSSHTQPWDLGGVGEQFWVNLSSQGPLPEGTYAVEVLVEGVPMFSETISIGAGTQPPAGRLAETDEVFISGTVRDAITGEGVPGALVFILDVALESPLFTWDESEIHTQTITDREGAFSFTRGLLRGNFYTAYVFAEGYITVVEDNFTIPGDQESPVNIVIEISPP